MSNRDFRPTLTAWFRKNPLTSSGVNADNLLFQMLYNSYCRIVGNGRTFDDVKQDASYVEACGELFAWYKDRYTRLGLQKGTQGQKRYVTGNEETYTFNLLYCDDRQFRNYLLTDTPQSGNQDLCSFVLHTAVAFLVPPMELDAVLQKLGFHPLHVRNIHHLAVHTVLTSAQQSVSRLPGDYNPFETVSALYDRALELLASGKTAEPEGFRYEDQLTRQIRQKLFLERGLTLENFEAIVRSNAPDLNMRHSLILEDFHQLTAVYTTIFEEYEAESEQYSFYQLVNRFCTPVSEKKFREYISSMIDKNQKHPTRQMLILLWFYDYCFSFVDGIILGDEAFGKILKKLTKYNPQWASEAKMYRRGLVFDASGFINRTGYRRGSGQFQGSDFLAVMNRKLLQRYGWGYLNERLPFDYYITKLCSLSILPDTGYAADNRVVIRLGKEALSDRYSADLDVPFSLVVLEEVLTQLTEVIETESQKLHKSKAKKISPFPLDCRIYEQI